MSNSFQAEFASYFPLLSKAKKSSQTLVYFDNAATTQKPQQMLDILTHYYQFNNANVHRAAHRLSQQTTQQYEQARNKIKNFINAASEQEVIWTKGTTEAINLVAHSWGQQNVKPGDDIVVSHGEHHANIVPWQLLAERNWS